MYVVRIGRALPGVPIECKQAFLIVRAKQISLLASCAFAENDLRAIRIFHLRGISFVAFYWKICAGFYIALGFPYISSLSFPLPLYPSPFICFSLHIHLFCHGKAEARAKRYRSTFARKSSHEHFRPRV
ncbi:hypothetical protein PUN28_005460 [Cardiocondyla obscurior]|uniref:Uncharacterized protein n=1 Tax=Cardiocondyla obscurior TaxID=286306 RepID=A0AAW2GK02_9HYME